eukprot:m51a1_g14582 hypothetical protein (76) ;mRNA; r:1123553-1123780
MVIYTPELCSEIKQWAKPRSMLVDWLCNHTKESTPAKTIQDALARNEDFHTKHCQSPLPSGPAVTALVESSPWVV